MSYDYGFNNQVGVLLVGFSIFFWGVLGYVRGDCKQTLFAKTDKLLMSHLICGLLFSSIYIIYMALCGNYSLIFNDSSFFFDHFYEMTYGTKPYEDFAFGYGPLSIYIPFWVYSIVPCVSPINAYLVSLAFIHSIGLYGLYELINALNIGPDEKKWMFWIGFLVFFPFTLGMNYQAFRFIFPFWAMWRCHNMNYKLKFLFFPLSVLITLAFSPEIGLVYWIALFIYCVLQYYVTRDKKFLIIWSLSLALNVGFVIAFLPMFVFVLSFGSGFMNFPFIPSFHLLVFFLCVFVVAYYMGGAFLQLDKYVFEISFVVLSFGFLPVCLGRCDPGHVILNGFFILSIAFILLIKFFKIIKKFVFGISIVFIMMIYGYILPLYGFSFFPAILVINNIDFFYNHKSDIVRMASYVNISGDVVDDKITSLYFKYGQSDAVLSSSAGFSNLIENADKISMPLYRFDLDWKTYNSLLSKGKLEVLYFSHTQCVGTNNVIVTVKELQEKCPRFLLLHHGWKDLARSWRYDWVSKSLFFAYYPVLPYRNGNLVNKPLVNYILKNYKRINSDNNYLIYERID